MLAPWSGTHVIDKSEVSVQTIDFGPGRDAHVKPTYFATLLAAAVPRGWSWIS